MADLEFQQDVRAGEHYEYVPCNTPEHVHWNTSTNNGTVRVEYSNGTSHSGNYAAGDRYKRKVIAGEVVGTWRIQPRDLVGRFVRLSLSIADGLWDSPLGVKVINQTDTSVTVTAGAQVREFPRSVIVAWTDTDGTDTELPGVTTARTFPEGVDAMDRALASRAEPWTRTATVTPDGLTPGGEYAAWMEPDRGVRDQAIEYARAHNLTLKEGGIPIEPELMDTAPLLAAVEAHRLSGTDDTTT